MAKKSDSNDDGKDASAPAAAEAPPGIAININAQYIKDLSFEAPAAPGIFSTLQGSPPDIKVNINVNVNRVQDKTFEVVLEMQAECIAKEQNAFILELQYAGLFTLNVPDEHLQAILLIECPRLLFPFARNILADVTRNGGFPPLFLGVVDFAGMYQAKLNEMQQAAGAAKA